MLPALLNAGSGIADALRLADQEGDVFIGSAHEMLQHAHRLLVFLGKLLVFLVAPGLAQVGELPFKRCRLSANCVLNCLRLCAKLSSSSGLATACGDIDTPLER